MKIRGERERIGSEEERQGGQGSKREIKRASLLNISSLSRKEQSFATDLPRQTRDNLCKKRRRVYIYSKGGEEYKTERRGEEFCGPANRIYSTEFILLSCLPRKPVGHSCPSPPSFLSLPPPPPSLRPRCCNPSSFPSAIFIPRLSIHHATTRRATGRRFEIPPRGYVSSLDQSGAGLWKSGLCHSRERERERISNV